MKNTVTITASVTLVLLLVGTAWGEAAPDPLSPEAVSARIQKCRTAEVTLTLTDEAGKPLANTAVRVEQVRHQFLFGANIFELRPNGAAAEQKAYQERFAALLNYATLPFYWGAFENQQGKPDTARLRATAEWCAARSILTKGHPLTWHEVLPKWLEGKTPEETQALELSRITREVKGFAGLIDRWDVVNESVATPTYQADRNPIAQLCQKLGRTEFLKVTFTAAHEANPKASLVLNDYDTSPKYEEVIKEALAAGIPIDTIGIQSHMHGGYWGAQRTWEVCERFARFGKPLHFTEVTLISGEMKKNINYGGHYDDWATTPEGEARQAREVEEFYRTLFSHPAVQAITWWDLSDTGAWLGAPSGLVRKDQTAKPAYETLMRLVKKEWWTGPLDLKTDGEGKVTFRGFLGQYAATVSDTRATFNLPQAGTAALTVRLLAPNVR